MADLSNQQPFTMTPQGAVALPPGQLLQMLVTIVSAAQPGYTANLPGSLIADVSGTEVGGLSLISNAAVETVNSLTPFTANQYVLTLLGNVYGVPQGQDTNTSVYVVFTSSSPGFVIVQGFTVSDGTYQYVVQDGGVTGNASPPYTSPPLFCIATVAGSWAVPEGSVTQIVTSVPSTITVTCTNPQTGIPSPGAQTAQSYQAQVLQAGLAAAVGMVRFLKTLLGNVAGVQPRLISAQPQTGGGWKIIVGGGDPYQVANAIFFGVADISTLVGSSLFVAGYTNAATGIVSTAPYYHGLVNGQTATISGASPSGFNGSGTVTVHSLTTFDIGVNTSGFGAYTGGGVVTPNPRNVAPVIDDYPDAYAIPIVVPPQITVTMTVTWNTNSLNFVSAPTIAALMQPALAAYINTIPVGAPLNTLELQTVAVTSVASVLSPWLISSLTFAVAFNGTGVSPEGGTTLIFGDPESFFFTQPSNITVTQG